MREVAKCLPLERSMMGSVSGAQFASPGVEFNLLQTQGWASRVMVASATVPFKDLGAVIVWGESSILTSEYGLDYLA
jgi:hypothetical protein